ncbi:phage tail assembly chaperone [Parachitinimonas caeni]
MSDCLRWWLEWGAQQALLQAVEAETGQCPAALSAQPELQPDSLRWWQAFHDLSPSRPAGWGPAPIPVSEILAYAELLGFDAADRPFLLQMIRACDAVWLAWQAERDKERPHE